MTIADGSEPADEYYGTLDAYLSLSKAQDAGIDWALEQFRDRLDRYDPPLATKEDRDAASEDWRKLESEQGDVWSYTISKDDVTLIVRAERYVAYGSHIPRFDDDGGRRTLAR